jgi:hypothetical protein
MGFDHAAEVDEAAADAFGLQASGCDGGLGGGLAGAVEFAKEGAGGGQAAEPSGVLTGSFGVVAGDGVAEVGLGLPVVAQRQGRLVLQSRFHVELSSA